MSEEEEFERKPRPWIIAIIAVVTVIAASMLTFRAFNARANAEVEAHPQSVWRRTVRRNPIPYAYTS